MKKWLTFAVWSVTSVGLINAASAADMAVKARPAPPPVVTYSWTGCYVGGNVGGGQERLSQTQIAKVTGVAIVPNNNFGSSDGTDFVGGGQIGCDYQFNNFVVGIQGMYDYGRIGSTHVVPTAFPGFPVGSFNSVNQVKDMWTVTGRVGYLFTPALLGYVKGGGAWTRVDHVFNRFVPVTFVSETAFGVNRQGWTVGGGLEWMFAKGWSVFGEFNYMDFGNKDVAFVQAPGTVGVSDVVRTRLEIEQFIVGVNYKFNFAQPVVAKY